jgi:hypothetical protein
MNYGGRHMKAKEGVQNGAGIPGITASETDAGLTSPQANPTEHTIDLKATYKDPRDPEKTRPGEELLQQMSRGGILDQVQSKLHKQIQDLTVEATAGEKAKTLATDLQSKLDRIEQQKVIREELDALNLKSQSKPVDEQLWPDDEEKKTVEIDSDYVLRGIEKMKADAKKDFEDTAASSLETILARDRAKEATDQARQKRIEDFVSRTRRSDLDSYKADYPTAPEEKLVAIVDTNTTATELRALATRAYSEGDDETAEQAYVEGRAREREALKALAEVSEKDGKAQQKLEQQEQIELIARGGPPGTETKRTREMNPKKAEQLRTERREKAKEIERLGDRYRKI